MRAALILCALAVRAAAEPAPLALPRGSNVDGDRVQSRLGFRPTLDFLERQWKKTHLVVERIGPTHVAGVDVVRYLAREAGAWSAVHVYRAAGVVWIFVVRPPLDDEHSSE